MTAKRTLHSVTPLSYKIYWSCSHMTSPSCIISGVLHYVNYNCEAVSRVLSFKMIIYLGRSLPAASSNLPGDETGRLMVSLFGLASDGVYTATAVTGRTVVSYTAFSPLRRLRRRGFFLLHWPGSHLRRTLSGILPCEARTFLVSRRTRDHPPHNPYSVDIAKWCSITYNTPQARLR